MLGPIITLILLSVALAWSVFLEGGVSSLDWNVTLLIVGLASTPYWLFSHRNQHAPPLKLWLRCCIYLLPAYITFQLIPLPISVLQILSPDRALLVRQLSAAVPGVTSAPLSVNIPAAVLNLFTFSGYIATFLLVSELAWRFSARPWVLLIPLIGISSAEAAIGIFQVFAGWPSANASGTYVNRDHFSGLLEMSLPFAALYGLAILRGNRDRFTSPMMAAVGTCVLWAAAAAILLAIIYSLSRMGFLAALCALFTVGALTIGPRLPSRAWRLASLTVMGLVIVLMVVFFPPNQLIERFADLSSSEDISGDTRLALWKETLPVIAHYPVFGCGLGGFESVFLKYQVVAPGTITDFAHNDYLQYLAELGIIGFALLAATVIGILLQIIRGVLRLEDETRRLLAIACAGSFVAILLHSIVDFNMYIPANAMTFAWIAGVGSANGLDGGLQNRSRLSRRSCCRAFLKVV